MSQDNPIPPLPPEPSSQTPPSSPVPPVPARALPYASASTPLTQDEKTMGMLCHLLPIFCGFLGPLILWLVKKDESPFVNDQGKEALNFQLTVTIAALATLLSSIVCCFLIFCLFAVIVMNLVFCIIAAVEANKGNAYRYPYSLRMIS